ncbi:glycerophosphodiester phosphodiesterase domain-containing protein 5 [Labeo rohita]|uniref:glycerophosphodiester phosphodiesterase domain-containing protein 5 n=1 Tax=Labeo rohita TaxID=84645 RepID=UPI0021E2FF5F|nr:glycerophosphodiester phosphodiesterase domain-containing protein 5 [Labeo rohita]
MLNDRVESCKLLTDYFDVFISCLNSQSGGTHSLQRIHWRASDIMLNFYKSVVLKRQAHLQSGQLARWKMSGMHSYNPEQIMLSAVVRRPSRDVNLMKEKLIFSGETEHTAVWR